MPLSGALCHGETTAEICKKKNGKLISVGIDNYDNLFKSKYWTFIHARDDNFEYIKKMQKSVIKTFCTCPRAETRLTVYRSHYIGFGPVERLNIKFTKKCILLMQILMLSCLWFIKISILIILKLRRKLAKVCNDKKMEGSYPGEIV